LKDTDPIAEFEKLVLELLSAPNVQPMTRSEIARALAKDSKDRPTVRNAVRSLEASGKLQRFKKSRYGLPKEPHQKGRQLLRGTIRFADKKRGRNAFLELDGESRKAVIERGDIDRIFIPARFTGTALHGDEVSATFHEAEAPRWHKHVKKLRERMNRPAEQRLEGRVSKVDKRARTRFVGTLKLHREKFAHVVPDDPTIPINFSIEARDLPLDAADEQKVLVQMLEWDSPFKAPRGRVVKVLGNEGDPGVDILSIIHRHDLPLEFPDEILRAAKSVDETITEEEIASREDWRNALVFTIDPADARDFDDAICVRKNEDGSWELAVFIADVAHYVQPKSPLDVEARRRGNSVYLVDRVVPMLPEKLSNGICSLIPEADRLTHSVILEFDAGGHRKKSRFAKTVIRSKQRFAYEEAFEILQKPRPADDEIANAIHDGWELASILRTHRMANGSLDLDFPEVRVVLDETGKPIELKLVEHDESHQLVEEFMLAANEAIAELTKNRGAASIYRIHEDPDLDKLSEFRELALSYEYEVGDLSQRSEIQKLLRAIRGRPEEHNLTVGLLKSLKRAAYSEEPMGHYGLAKVNYTHFTSPIRRYADLVVHRVLERLATRTDEKRATPGLGELAEVAEHLSKTERTAADAENESKLLKQFEYFLNIANSGDRQTFVATVMEVLPKGVFVELRKYFLRGMIRRDDLPKGELYFNAKFQRVTNTQGAVVLSPGKEIEVIVRRVDIESKHLDLVPA
jgi:ribonuclease R